MPQHRLNDLHVSPAGQRQRRRAMPKVVQADRWQLRLLDDPLEVPGDVVRVERGPVLAGEHESGVLPGFTPEQPLLQLLRPVGLQHGDRCGVKRDHSRSAVRLRLPDLGCPAELHDLLADRQRPPIKVDVGPGHSSRFASAQAPERDQVVEAIQPVTGERVEELTGLRRQPHRDLRAGEPTRLPCLHAVSGPDHRLRPPGGWQLDVLGDVQRHHLTLLSGAEGAVEGGVDPVDACGCQRTFWATL